MAQSSASTWHSLLQVQAKFIGPGAVAAVAYIDPGNWATCIEAGSKYGYSLLFIVLASSLAALFFQVICSRVGTVTGRDIATLMRRELLREDASMGSLSSRRLLLYSLYAIAELGIVVTDLAELIGSAIAINLLTGGSIALSIAVLLTIFDVLVFLAIFNSYPDRHVSKSGHVIEIIIAALVIITLSTIVALIVRLRPDFGDVFSGFIPSDKIISNGALFVSISILGATAMPHSYYLGGKLGAMERYNDVKPEDEDSDVDLSTDQSLCCNTDGELRSLLFVKTHLLHSTVDTVVSLLAIAMVTNASIVIFSAAAFHFKNGSGNPEDDGVSDLFDTFHLIYKYVGQIFAYLFAVGLLMAGQASSITVTLAGQIVSEGFLEWRTSPVVRRCVTRLLGIVPSFFISVFLDRKGIAVALIVSQVILSLCLPFTLVPLMLISSNKEIMSVKIVNAPQAQPDENQPLLESPARVSFATGRCTNIIGWTLVAIISICNLVALVQTIQEGG